MRFESKLPVGDVRRGTRPTEGVRTAVRHFAREEGGATAPMFALMVMPLVMFVGMAVDYSRMVAAQNAAQQGLDSAALAAARAAQLNSNDPVAAATAAANAYIAKMENPYTVSRTLQITPSNANTRIHLVQTMWVKTPFMAPARWFSPGGSVTGAPAGSCNGAFSCGKVVARASSEIKSGGSNDSTSIELAMMLDVTGSMAGSKIEDLKDAAKDLIDIVVWDQQTSSVYSKVAIAPFSDSVYVGEDVVNAIGEQEIVNTSTTGSYTAWSRHFKFSSMRSYNNGSWRQFRVSTKCLTERQGTNKFSDAAPGPTSRIARHYHIANYGTSQTSTSDVCTQTDSDAESNLMTALSTNKAMLKSRIDKLKVKGATAGQLGTAWAWYLLSPDFMSAMPASFKGADGTPASYTRPKTKKIAVLMTDGDYNTQFCNGVLDKNSNSPTANCSSPNGSSKSQAEALCTAMKQKGIEVYTIGFQVSSSARTMLKACATDVAHYYDATSGDALRAAFRDIALKVATIRLIPPQ